MIRLLSKSVSLWFLIAGVAACRGVEHNPPPVITKANAEQKRILGDFRRIAGTNFMLAAINSTASGESFLSISSSSGYGSSSSAHNYVFLDVTNNQTRLLLPNNDGLVVAAVSLPERRERDVEPDVKYFLFGIVRADTDADKQLDGDDRRVLAISDAGGGGYREIIAEVEHVFGYTMTNPDTLVVVYKRGGKHFATRVDLPSREIVTTSELPSFGIDAQ